MLRFRLVAVISAAVLSIGVAGCDEFGDDDDDDGDEESRIESPERLDTAVIRSEGAGYIQATITGLAIGSGARDTRDRRADEELAPIPVRTSTIAAPRRMPAGSAIEGRWTPATNMCAVVWVNVASEKISTSGDVTCAVTDRLRAGNGYELAANCAAGEGEGRDEIWMITTGEPGMITVTREGDDPVRLLRCP